MKETPACLGCESVGMNVSCVTVDVSGSGCECCSVSVGMSLGCVSVVPHQRLCHSSGVLYELSLRHKL